LPLWIALIALLALGALAWWLMELIFGRYGARDGRAFAVD
jgi:hypothetical protein